MMGFMTMFDLAEYGPAISNFLVRQEPNELGPGSPNRAMESSLRSLTIESMFPGKRIADRDMARGCLAGLWLLHDFLNESHSISQELHSTTGSYWHGIMHRREPDYGNAKYWFRRVGQHPVFEPLLAQVRASERGFQQVPELVPLLKQPSWDPFLFVDLCERAARRSDQLAEACRVIAGLEWQILFDDCFRRAAGIESDSPKAEARKH